MEELKQPLTKVLPNCFVWSDEPPTQVATPITDVTPAQQAQGEPNGDANGELNYPCTGAARSTPTPRPTPTGIVLLIFFGYVIILFGYDCKILNECETPTGLF